MQGRCDELEAFKSEINLTEYLASCGYVLDRHASSRNSAVMKHAAGHKVIVARGPDRHWTYFSIGDTRDSGSIIDFVQHRQGVGLGEVRRLLHPWIGRDPRPVPRPPAEDFVADLTPATKDLARIIHEVGNKRASESV